MMQRWDESLEKAAQLQTDSCYLKKDLATNVYYNDSELIGEPTHIGQLSSAGQKMYLLYTSFQISGYFLYLFSFSLYCGTSAMGCNITLCGRLSQDTSDFPLRNSYFVACKYSPSYFISSDGSLYKPGRCRDPSWPNSAVCVPYLSQVKSHHQLYLYCGKLKGRNM